MLSLDGGKVYVGIVSSLGEPNENEGLDQEISIIPIMSGYREKETLSVKFNTHYDFENIEGDLELVIKQSIINSATKFDFSVFETFNDPDTAN